MVNRNLIHAFLGTFTGIAVDAIYRAAVGTADPFPYLEHDDWGFMLITAGQLYQPARIYLQSFGSVLIIVDVYSPNPFGLLNPEPSKSISLGIQEILGGVAIIAVTR